MDGFVEGANLNHVLYTQDAKTELPNKKWATKHKGCIATKNHTLYQNITSYGSPLMKLAQLLNNFSFLFLAKFPDNYQNFKQATKKWFD